MSEARTPLLGLCPIGKFVFSNEDAVRYKEALQARLTEWGVRYVDLEGVLEHGLIRDQAHVDIAVAHLREAGVSCLFVPHCNFGTEGAVGMIGRKLGVPVLLWGPRDEAPLPDGTRYRDTLCGMFASSKVLHKLDVPFSYIENCRLDDPPLRQGVERFLGAVNAAEPLRTGMRIGHIGQRIDFFWTTIINESELLERFHVEVLPLDMVRFIDAVLDRAKQGWNQYEKEAAECRAKFDIQNWDDDDTPLINNLALRDQMLAMREEHGLDAFALESFPSLPAALGGIQSLGTSMVSDECPVGGESDICGAISNVLIERANLNRGPAWLADLTVRHPEDDNGILLWHGAAPLSMRAPEATVRLAKHWILPSPLSGMGHFALKQGPITVARFDGDRGEYRLAVGQGRSMNGPDTLNNYVWMKVDDWPRWERTLMQGPFIHHAAMLYAHCADALVEACRFVPGLEPVRLDRASD